MTYSKCIHVLSPFLPGGQWQWSLLLCCRTSTLISFQSQVTLDLGLSLLKRIMILLNLDEYTHDNTQMRNISHTNKRLIKIYG